MTVMCLYDCHVFIWLLCVYDCHVFIWLLCVYTVVTTAGESRLPSVSLLSCVYVTVMCLYDWHMFMWRSCVYTTFFVYRPFSVYMTVMCLYDWNMFMWWSCVYIVGIHLYVCLLFMWLSYVYKTIIYLYGWSYTLSVEAVTCSVRLIMYWQVDKLLLENAALKKRIAELEAEKTYSSALNKSLGANLSHNEQNTQPTAQVIYICHT